MAASRSNRSSNSSSSPVTRNTGKQASAPVTPPPIVRSEPIANPVEAARAIANRSKTPIQRAQAIAGKEVPAEPYIPVTLPRPTILPVQTLTGKEPKRNVSPIVYDLKPDPVNPEGPVISVGRPNPEYVKTIPPPPPPLPPRDPEAPITESIISKAVDEIIQGSNEVIKEVVIKQAEVRAPVDTNQDIVRPPVPITPTELLLENQKDCEQRQQIPSIIINNNNEIIIDLSEPTEPSEDIEVNTIVVEALIPGCMDPDGLNYDPLATTDDGSCVYDPVEDDDVVIPGEPPIPHLDIPVSTPYVDSHGRTIFIIPRELVELTERTTKDGIITLKSGQKIVANMSLIHAVNRPAQQDSDLIHTPVSNELAERVTSRELLGGELAGDTKLPAEEDIVIMGDKEKLVTQITRNNNGIIIIREGDTSKLNVSLRSKSFSFNQYQQTIDTEFTQLVGKM